MNKNISRVLMGALGALVLAGTQTGVSYADGANIRAIPALVTGEAGGAAEFKPYGEHLYIEDNVADGNSIVAHMQYGSKDQWWFNHDGSGTTRHLDFDITDGTAVHLAACRGNWGGSVEDSEIFACGLWKHTTA
ncbi:hypothetical protein SLINC_5424 [Streptomyces lincolnensis]|uniref:Uncharacterized protein n=1 Tax=Streptomyces lincolnensis TaxID=1915 RepID=A0A1B1MGB7_STRLN|nr:hypothetical protein [Streptomyces lincolnensis]ANS67648.1 hypothetical protein SLINC_5424 [Streptomyces lincolnensis]AXG54963.1 hypothetical protein SLCG_3808 [Streptomyces lincolnensis]QMV09311.1 hypothetical protein GJU35_29140 [Streptomyces lincolnensis]